MQKMVEIVPKMVREVIDTELTDKQINGVISTASKTIETKVLPAADRQGITLDPGLQVEIARWLAAHYVSIRDSTTKISKEKIGDAEVDYYIETSKGSSRWLVEAQNLDPTKALLGLSGRKLGLYIF